MRCTPNVALIILWNFPFFFVLFLTNAVSLLAEKFEKKRKRFHYWLLVLTEK